MTRRRDPEPISTKLIISIFLTNHTKLEAFSPPTSSCALPSLLANFRAGTFLTPPPSLCELLRWVPPTIRDSGHENAIDPPGRHCLPEEWCRFRVGWFLPTSGALFFKPLITAPLKLQVFYVVGQPDGQLLLVVLCSNCCARAAPPLFNFRSPVKLLLLLLLRPVQTGRGLVDGYYTA